MHTHLKEPTCVKPHIPIGRLVIHGVNYLSGTERSWRTTQGACLSSCCSSLPEVPGSVGHQFTSGSRIEGFPGGPGAPQPCLGVHRSLILPFPLPQHFLACHTDCSEDPGELGKEKQEPGRVEFACGLCNLLIDWWWGTCTLMWLLLLLGGGWMAKGTGVKGHPVLLPPHCPEQPGTPKRLLMVSPTALLQVLFPQHVIWGLFFSGRPCSPFQPCLPPHGWSRLSCFLELTEAGDIPST